ncbi:hypothetical protein MBOURGENBZM_18650 [Methanoculleus bourgensis]|nr:hypothetical protein MBOURGENBZM_18650 [Methanoculleus bourgensis]
MVGVAYELDHTKEGDSDQEKREHPREETPPGLDEYEVKIPKENEYDQHHERGGKERDTCCRPHRGFTVIG